MINTTPPSMDFYQTCFSSASYTQQHDHDFTADLKRGPWTVEEDSLLLNYVTLHGEGRWNSVARQAGLKRTGKSCRLRWLNYLRPDLRRGDMTPQEQLLILELHSRWGNKWSKMAQYLPGRTDNEIKNYWRTRVQKQAKLLRCDVNSKKFQDAMKYVWMPRLREQIASGRTKPCTPIFHEPITAVMDPVFDLSQHHGFDNVPHDSSSFLPEMSVSNSDNSSSLSSLISDLFDGYIESSSPDTGSVANPTYDQAVQMSQPLLDAPDSSSFVVIPEISSSTYDNSSVSCHVTLVSEQSEGWVPEYEDCNTWLGGASDGVEDNLLMTTDNWWSEENMRFLQEQLSDDSYF